MFFARSRSDPKSLFPSLGSRGNNSVLMGFVNTTISRNSRARKMINQEFRVLIRDGRTRTSGMIIGLVEGNCDIFSKNIRVGNV